MCPFLQFQAGDDYLQSLASRYAHELGLPFEETLENLSEIRTQEQGFHTTTSNQPQLSPIYSSIGPGHTYANVRPPSADGRFQPGIYAVIKLLSD